MRLSGAETLSHSGRYLARYSKSPESGVRNRGGFDERFGLIIGIVAEADTSYELLYSTQEANIQGPYDLNVRAEHLHLGGTAQFDQSERIAPSFPPASAERG